MLRKLVEESKKEYNVETMPEKVVINIDSDAPLRPSPLSLAPAPE